MSSNIVTVDFKNDTIFAIERDDGVYVAVKPIAQKLGLSWQGQLQRLKDDPVLSKGVTTIVIPSPGGAQEMTCLRLDKINGWLFKIDSRRVKDEAARQKVLEYQEECHQVLYEHFHGISKGANPIGGVVDLDLREAEKHSMRKVDLARHIFGERSAGQLWFQLGLDRVPDMVIDGRQLSFIDYKAIKTASDTEEAA